MKKLLLFTLTSFLIAFSSATLSAHPVDSLGKFVKKITTNAQFNLFDEGDSNIVILRCYGFNTKMIYGAPEMRCFIANHTKDDLQATYEIYEKESPEGSTVRSSKLLRLVSLKSGDDTKTWLEKEQSDSTLAARHHEQLTKITKEMAR